MTPEEAIEIARYRDWPAPPYVALGRKVIDDRGDVVYEAPYELKPKEVCGITFAAEMGSFRAKAVADMLNRGGFHAERMRRRLKRD